MSWLMPFYGLKLLIWGFSEMSKEKMNGTFTYQSQAVYRHPTLSTPLADLSEQTQVRASTAQTPGQAWINTMSTLNVHIKGYKLLRNT